MPEITPLSIGAKVICSDGVCGRMTQVIVDPIAEKVTHVMVEPEHRQGLGRLVPVELVEVHGEQVTLDCSRAEFDKLEPAEEIRFVRGAEGYGGYSPGHVLVWPYFGGNTSIPITIETLPVGEVAVQRGDDVYADDSHIGEVEGLIVDSRSHHVTHVLLKEGHLFGRKDVAVPVGAVKSLDDGVRLSMSKQEVDDLPTVDFRRPTQ